MTQNDSCKREFIVMYSSRGLGVHHTWEARQQEAGVAAGAGSQGMSSLISTVKESELEMGRGYRLSNPTLSDVRSSVRLYPPNLPKQCHQWGGPSVPICDPMGHISHLNTFFILSNMNQAKNFLMRAHSSFALDKSYLFFPYRIL